MVRDEIEMNKLLEIRPDKILPPVSTTYILTKVETSEASNFLNFSKRRLQSFSLVSEILHSFLFNLLILYYSKGIVNMDNFFQPNGQVNTVRIRYN